MDRGAVREEMVEIGRQIPCQRGGMVSVIVRRSATLGAYFF
ncbi:unnamed protein product [Linum tenue]|uniref:Uncharacterized protein n=1 Tax=Linum tenue TaxID=586396 RepID=A0AAV0JTC0_9ROSI|nr:unnamed protein product [Linum tenue]